ncbi:SET domain-containing protein [Candidatus Kaiserbacteria bacterium]|nr:SET domain-containing protein [Candidatus Kaiserbacteria bacterium]
MVRTLCEQVIVRRSRPGLGRGLFATRALRAGGCIVEYTGKRVPTAHADTLKTRYLLELDEHWTIDGSARDNLARYINHSCSPNCEGQLESGRVFIHATCDIKKDEELTLDYGDEYFDEFIRPRGCKCERCLR